MADLKGKKGLIPGVANQDNVACGCACALRESGAELALGYLNAKAREHRRHHVNRRGPSCGIDPRRA